MDPTSVLPPDSATETASLDISLASEERLSEMLPYTLGRYRLIELIGEGGMARVFRAILRGPAGFEKIVAIKILKPSAQNRAADEDFMQEAVYAGRLHHPNIVDVYELGEVQNCPYIAMELVDGEPLHKLLDPNLLLPPSVILDLLLALLNGLEQAHEGGPTDDVSGMLHRDIKPSNIIVSRYGVPKLVDFGIAAQLDHAAGIHRPVERTVIGTIAWMSPEQLQAMPLDERSDLFSFGLVMATTILCRNPIPRKYMYEELQKGNQLPDCMLTLEDETELDSHMPGLGKIVAQLLSRERAERPRNARALRKLLQELRPLVGYRPSLPQWMKDRLNPPVEGTESLMNETTWVMEGTAPFPEANTVVAQDGNIPRDDSLFVGRTEDFATLKKHLQAGERLISLVGTGGAGKTRLSRRVANHFSQEFAGGAWFVDLCDVDSEDGIIRAVAKAMGIQLLVDGAKDAVQQLGEAIAKRGRLLIVLDNFEQLVAHGPNTVGQWLEDVPLAQFLVTTRELLLIQGELRVSLAPLSQEDAVVLLQQRVQLAGASWPDDQPTRQVMENIVDALDRLPLAIELAAARSPMLSPEELRDRLDERFKLLRDGTRGQTDRQATLFNLIDWSWQRLEPWEQSALAQLSCFRGGFSMEAAEAIIDLRAWPAAPWTLDVIGALLEKSLLHTQTVNEQRKMFMYVSIREFADVQLMVESTPITGAEIAKSTRVRHATYFAGFSPVEDTGSMRVVDPSARRELHANFENMMVAARTGVQPQRTLCAVGALEVLMSQGPMSQAVALTKELLTEKDVPQLLALRLRVVQAQSLRMMGRISEAQQALSSAVQCAEDAEVSPVSDALMELNEVAAGLPVDDEIRLSFEVDRRIEESSLLRVEGRNVDAKRVLEEALALCSPTRTPTLQAKVQHALGWLLWTMGKVKPSITNLRESRAAYQVAGQRKDEAIALSALAYVLFKMGKSRTAHPMFLECLALFEGVADPTAPRQVLSKLGNLERAIGELESSLEHFEQAVALQDRVGDVMNGLINRIDLAKTLLAMNRIEEAESKFMEVIASTRKRETFLLEAMAIGCLGDLCRKTNRIDEAIVHYRFAYDTFRDKFPSVATAMAISLAVMLARSGELDELDDLTLGKEQHVEALPREQLVFLRDLAEVRLAQQEPAASYRHIGRAREVAKQLENGPDPEIAADLDELERRILGKG